MVSSGTWPGGEGTVAANRQCCWKGPARGRPSLPCTRAGCRANFGCPRWGQLYLENVPWLMLPPAWGRPLVGPAPSHHSVRGTASGPRSPGAPEGWALPMSPCGPKGTLSSWRASWLGGCTVHGNRGQWDAALAITLCRWGVIPCPPVPPPTPWDGGEWPPTSRHLPLFSPGASGSWVPGTLLQGCTHGTSTET